MASKQQKTMSKATNLVWRRRGSGGGGKEGEEKEIRGTDRRNRMSPISPVFFAFLSADATSVLATMERLLYM